MQECETRREGESGLKTGMRESDERKGRKMTERLTKVNGRGGMRGKKMMIDDRKPSIHLFSPSSSPPYHLVYNLCGGIWHLLSRGTLRAS
jgi:hypothetical protein